MPLIADESHAWKTPPKDWAEEQALRTARAIRTLRGKRSAQWLSDRTEELGYAVSRSVISDLELGRRRYISTAEVTILASALRVPPAYLLYPDLPDDPIDVIPGIRFRSVDALMWFSGELAGQPSTSDQPPKPCIHHHNLGCAWAVELVKLSRQQAQLRKRLDALSELAEQLRPLPDGARAAGVVTSEIAEIGNQLKEIESALRPAEALAPIHTRQDGHIGG